MQMNEEKDNQSVKSSLICLIESINNDEKKEIEEKCCLLIDEIHFVDAIDQLKKLMPFVDRYFIFLLRCHFYDEFSSLIKDILPTYIHCEPSRCQTRHQSKQVKQRFTLEKI